MPRFRVTPAGSPTHPYGEVLWRMDDEYQAQLLFLLQGVQASLAKAKTDPTPENVREAWALVDELVDSAVAYLPVKYYDAARAWLKKAAKDMRVNKYVDALSSLLRARYNVLAGFRAIGLMGRRRVEVEDIETQALKMLEEAIAKKKKAKIPQEGNE